MQRATKYIRNRMMNGIRKKLRKGNMSICNSAGILANACQISIKFCVFRTKSDTNVSKFHGIRLNFSVSIKPSAIFLDSALFRIFWNLTNRKKNDLTKNISRVHFCVNGKRNRTRMKAHVQLFMTTSKNPKCAVLFANAKVRGLIRKCRSARSYLPQEGTFCAESAASGPCSHLGKYRI